jgi:hypothetical protein
MFGMGHHGNETAELHKTEKGAVHMFGMGHHGNETAELHKTEKEDHKHLRELKTHKSLCANR